MELFELLLDLKLANVSDEEIHSLVQAKEPIKRNDGPMMVTDITGVRMSPNTHYTLRGEKVLVLREEYGAGNLLNTYYRVFYLDTDLIEHIEVVEAKFATRYSVTYPSLFTPIKSL